MDFNHGWKNYIRGNKMKLIRRIAEIIGDIIFVGATVLMVGWAIFIVLFTCFQMVCGAWNLLIGIL